MDIIDKIEKFLNEISQNKKLNINKNNFQEIQKTGDVPDFLLKC